MMPMKWSDTEKVKALVLELFTENRMLAEQYEAKNAAESLWFKNYQTAQARADKLQKQVDELQKLVNELATINAEIAIGNEAERAYAEAFDSPNEDGRANNESV